MISKELLIEYGAREKKIGKNEFVFHEQETALSYFQVLEGEVKMNNYNDEGKEFIQGIFAAGKSFGEPPLFGNFKYPANAIAIRNSKVLVLPKSSFIQLLSEHSDIHLTFTEVLANRLYYKAFMVAEISSQEADHRILALLDYFKKSVHEIEGEYKYEVELTRQQIADLTGLRVETVIRTVKRMAADGKIKIVNRKVWR